MLEKINKYKTIPKTVEAKVKCLRKKTYFLS